MHQQTRKNKIIASVSDGCVSFVNGDGTCQGHFTASEVFQVPFHGAVADFENETSLFDGLDCLRVAAPISGRIVDLSSNHFVDDLQKKFIANHNKDWWAYWGEADNLFNATIKPVLVCETNHPIGNLASRMQIGCI